MNDQDTAMNNAGPPNANATQATDLAQRFDQLLAAFNQSQANLAESNAAAAQLEALLQQQHAEAQSKLKPFKVTSVKPPTFTGELRSKPAHEAQKTIDTYLHLAESQAALYGLLADDTAPKFLEHTTYTTWVSTGLQGHAFDLWRDMDGATRNSFTWAKYKEWVQESFGSKLTLMQALASLRDLRQTRSATEYTTEFNSLVAACASAGSVYSQDHLCHTYRAGLKTHLKSDTQLFKINKLKELQTETQRLDEFVWKERPSIQQRLGLRNHPNGFQPYGRNNANAPLGGRAGHQYSYQPQQNQGATPMELDNIQAHPERPPPLTPAERQEFFNKGWCSFCRLKTHNIRSCPVRPTPNPNAVPRRGHANADPARNPNFEPHPQRARINHVSFNTDSDDGSDDLRLTLRNSSSSQ